MWGDSPKTGLTSTYQQPHFRRCSVTHSGTFTHLPMNRLSPSAGQSSQRFEGTRCLHLQYRTTGQRQVPLKSRKRSTWPFDTTFQTNEFNSLRRKTPNLRHSPFISSTVHRNATKTTSTRNIFLRKTPRRYLQDLPPSPPPPSHLGYYSSTTIEKWQPSYSRQRHYFRWSESSLALNDMKDRGLFFPSASKGLHCKEPHYILHEQDKKKAGRFP